MRRIYLTVAAVLLLGSSLLAQEEPKPPAGEAPAGEAPPEAQMPSGPLTFFKVSGGTVHQFETDVDGGGSFDVNRFYIQPGVDIFFSRDLQVSVGLGYSYDRYAFSGGEGQAGAGPWDDVHSVQFGVLTRYVLDEEWTLFGAPAFRWSAEKDASLSDGFSFGLYGGAAWKASENLTIGPGVAFFTEIEESALAFPFLLIDWKIAEKWSFSTGSGLAATRGPGLVLAYEFADEWSVGLGGRWEQFRFRLDDEGPAQGGVGEEESIPLFLRLTWEPSKRTSVSLLAGANLYGSLTVSDESGDRLASEDYDPAAFLGIAFEIGL